MYVLLYFLCVILLLPVAAFAAFGALIDSLTGFGFWEVAKFVFAPLYDPLGRGIWVLLLLLSVVGLCGAGMFPASRPYGFGVIAAAGLLCGVYVCRVYPGPWEAGHIAFFLPGAVSVGLSLYCLVRPYR